MVNGYRVPKAYTINEDKILVHDKRQKAIDKFFEEHILNVRIRNEGRYTFSWANSELSKVFFNAHQFIEILEDAGYKVEYNKALKDLMSIVSLPGTDPFGGDERLKEIAMAQYMTIYW